MPGNLETGLHSTRTHVRLQEKTLISQGFLGKAGGLLIVEGVVAGVPGAAAPEQGGWRR